MHDIRVRRTDALMANILRREIKTQHPHRARMAVLPTHAIKQRTATPIKRRNHRAFFIANSTCRLSSKSASSGSKTPIWHQNTPQCRIGSSNRLLHRPMRKNHMEQQRHATIQRRTEQNHQRDSPATCHPAYASMWWQVATARVPNAIVR